MQQPQRIGDFRILRTLGEGGMGVVYEAEQDHPRRKVALKVIRAAHLTAEMLKRFEREAHVLGLLQHPGIAQIYQAGTADSGHGPEPYFAMELVQGRPLTQHAHDEHLPLRQKLELLARVCDAVQHAHQKGVVHRDLKPGNILVVAEDDPSTSTHAGSTAGSTARFDDLARVGQPKVLDFGLARLTESDLPAATLQTEIGQLLGTVRYMSPEQVTGESARIDSRSDVYALGVIGYELVSERLPYDLQGKAMLEALRTIREEEAARLSSIDRTLRGDVETIMAKALEKDPAQRYPTAADMAADIRRFLHDEPIVARPPSTIYQLRKFAARNKVLVGGIAAVFLALVAGLIGTGLGIMEARRNEAIARERGEEARQRAEEAVRSRDEATQARAAADASAAEARLRAEEALRSRDEATRARDEATKARAAADASAAEAQAINDFLVRDMLSSVNPNVSMGHIPTLEQVLENARTHADEAFKDQPLLSARLHATLGEVEYRLGRATEAERHFRVALRLRLEKLGPSDLLTIEVQSFLGRVLCALGRMTEGTELLRSAVEFLRARHDDERLVSELSSLGQAYRLSGDSAAAQPYYDEALHILDGLPAGASVSRTALPTILADRASLYNTRGLHEDAQRDYERSLQIYRELFGDVHPDVARVMGMLAINTRDLGHPDEAFTQLESVLAMQRKLFPKDHPDTARTLSLLAAIAVTRGDYVQAEARVREAIAMRSGLEGFAEVDVADDQLRLSEILSALGRHGEAAVAAEQALATFEKDTVPRSDQIANALYSIAIARRGDKDLTRAAEAAQRSLELRRGSKDRNPRQLTQAMSLMAQIYHARKENTEAEPLYREVRELYEQVDGTPSLNVAIADSNLGQFLLDQGKLEDAEKSLRAGIAMAELVLPPDHPILAAIRSSFGRALHVMKKDSEALEQLRIALDAQRKRLPPGHAAMLKTLLVMGQVLTATGNGEEAEPLLREVVEARRGLASGKSIGLADAMAALGACLVAQNRCADAEPLLLESQAMRAELGDDPEATSKAAQRLAELYEKLGRTKDAELWRSKTSASR